MQRAKSRAVAGKEGQKKNVKKKDSYDEFASYLTATETRDWGPGTIALQASLIGGELGAGPSSLYHTSLEGPKEYVNARWM